VQEQFAVLWKFVASGTLSFDDGGGSGKDGGGRIRNHRGFVQRYWNDVCCVRRIRRENHQTLTWNPRGRC